MNSYRKTLQRRGLARFEVLGLATDRKLIRTLAKRLAEEGSESNRLRTTIQTATDEAPGRGGIYAALRRSPMVGADIKLRREITPGRKVDL